MKMFHTGSSKEDRTSAFWAGIITVFCALAIVVEASLVIWARISRRTMNEPLKSKWLADLLHRDEAQSPNAEPPKQNLPATSQGRIDLD